LEDLTVTWHEHITKGTLELGWQEAEQAFHISASNLKLGALSSFSLINGKGIP
jgi:hypothetical protein